MTGETASYQTAAELPDKAGVVVVLKGNPTFVLGTDAWVVRSGGPELATIGTGDVLAGMIGALWARGVDGETAARSAAHWHGRAAAELARSRDRYRGAAQRCSGRVGLVRHSWIEVDLDAIRSNVAAIVSLVSPSEVCAVVKANAYGHGDVPSANAALAGGATRLAVALVEEGARLREAAIDAPILLLSEPRPGDAAEAVRWGLTPTVYTVSMVDELAALPASGPVAVHFKVDTGMHRVGAKPDAAVALAAGSWPRPSRARGLWTHFAVAEEDAEFTKRQLE